MKGEAVLGQLVELDAFSDVGRAANLRTFGVRFGRSVSLPAEIPALIDEFIELGLVMEDKHPAKIFHAEPKTNPAEPIFMKVSRPFLSTTTPWPPAKLARMRFTPTLEK